jgi:heme/copper-type cytochrome/quinol oxidase subunit 3
LTITGLVATAFLYVLASVLEIIDYNGQINSPGTTADELSASALFLLLVGLLGFVALLGTAVSFICWLYRARKNAEASGVGGFRWGPGWTIGSWFIPLANLVIPYRVVAEIDRANEPGLPGANVMAGSRRQTLLGFWWASWIAWSVLDRMAFFRVREAWDAAPPTGEQLLEGRAAEFGWIALESVVLVTATALAVLVVLRITRDQQRAFAPPQPYSWPASTGTA